MPETIKIDVIKGQKPDGLVKSGEAVAGSITPPPQPSREVVGHLSPVMRYVQCWQCSGIFYVRVLHREEAITCTCPICEAVNRY